MDAALMQSAGIPTISLGAAGGHFHAADEWVSLGELVTLGQILEATARAYCG
jgi:acetylornithine deacetylase